MIPAFTPQQLDEAQQQLRLSNDAMALMLGCTSQQLRRMKIKHEGKGAFRAVQPVTARLLKAYLDGYRPSDWPAS